MNLKSTVISVLSICVLSCSRGGGGGPPEAPPLGSLAVVLTSPAPASSGVSLGSPVSASFAEELDPASVTTASFLLFQGASQIPGSVQSSGGTASFLPAAPLQPGVSYTATLKAGIRSALDKNVEADYVWSFSTESLAPAISKVEPLPDLENASLSSAIQIQFTKPMAAQSVLSKFHLQKENGAELPGSLEIQSDLLRFQPSSALEEMTLYTASLDAGAQDETGQSMTEGYSWSFRTTELTRPEAVFLNPGHDAQNQRPDTVVDLQFSEPIDQRTLTATSFYLLDEAAKTVACAISYDETSRAARLTPRSLLEYDTNYSALVTDSVLDRAGNRLYAKQLHFKTSLPICAGPVKISNSDNENVTTPMTGADASGGGHAVYLRALSSKNELYAAHYSTTSGWETPLQIGGYPIGDNTRSVTQPRFACDSSGVCAAVWREKGDSSQKFFLIVKRWILQLSQLGWQTLPPLFDGVEAKVSEPRVAVDPQGNILVVWKLAAADGTVKLQSRRFNGSSSNWDDQLDIVSPFANGGTANCDLKFFPSGDAMAVWQDLSNDKVSLFAARYQSVTNSWDAPVLVETSDDGNVYIPKLAVNSSHQAVAVWLRSDANARYSLWASRYLDPSGWDASPALLEFDDDYDVDTTHGPRVALDQSGNAVVAWVQKVGADGLNPNLYSSEFRALQNTWTPPALLENGDGTAANPELEVDSSGKFSVCWDQVIDGNGDGIADGSDFTAVFKKTLQFSGGVWDPKPCALSLDPSRDCRGPAMSLYPAGGGIVLWLLQADNQKDQLWGGTVFLMRAAINKPDSTPSINLSVSRLGPKERTARVLAKRPSARRCLAASCPIDGFAPGENLPAWI